MKNIISLILSLLLISSLTACGASDISNPAASEPTAKPAPYVSETVTVDLADYVPNPSIPNLIGRAPASPTTWSVDVVTNYIPFTPDGYNGIMADYTKDYTDKEGNTVNKTYHVAFFTENDYKNYEYDSSVGTQALINGEMKFGTFVMHTEHLFFLECEKIDGSVTRYYLDIDLPHSIWYANVLEQNDKRAIISADSYLFVYNFESKICDLITKDALDYDYGSDGKLYFCDWSHDEFVCDWTNSAEFTKTGRQVIHYFSDDFSLTVDESFESDFYTMQKALREGTAKTSDFDHMYFTYSFGNIYDNTGYYLSNIHYPAPYVYNSNIFSDSSLGVWVSESPNVTLYRYGENVRGYNMGDGLWKIIDTYVYFRENSDGKYEINPYGDDIISPEEADRAIESIRFLMFNAKDNCIYISDNGKEPVKVAENVVDYCEAYGELYWMNSNLEAYELSWFEKTESVLIGTDVVGISHHTDERAGFVVAPGDPRCNAISGGTSLCTLYGREWLNQEQTSGAWALEHDWEKPEVC